MPPSSICGREDCARQAVYVFEESGRLFVADLHVANDSFSSIFGNAGFEWVWEADQSELRVTKEKGEPEVGDYVCEGDSLELAFPPFDLKRPSEPLESALLEAALEGEWTDRSY